jgi:hypothetical protein
LTIHRSIRWNSPSAPRSTRQTADRHPHARPGSGPGFGSEPHPKRRHRLRRRGRDPTDDAAGGGDPVSPNGTHNATGSAAGLAVDGDGAAGEDGECFGERGEGGRSGLVGDPDGEGGPSCPTSAVRRIADARRDTVPAPSTRPAAVHMSSPAGRPAGAAEAAPLVGAGPGRVGVSAGSRPAGGAAGALAAVLAAATRRVSARVTRAARSPAVPVTGQAAATTAVTREGRVPVRMAAVHRPQRCRAAIPPAWSPRVTAVTIRARSSRLM